MSDPGCRVRSGARAMARLFADARGPVLVTVALGWLVVLGTRFVVPAVLPRIKAEFGVSNATVGLAVTVTWVTYAAMQFPAGVLADRVGERHLLAGSLVVTGAGLLAFGAVPAFGLFLAAAAVFGLGTGLFGPSRGTVIAKTFPRRDGLAFGVVLAAGSLGAAGLPFLGSLITVRWGWRVALAGFAPACLLLAVWLWRVLPDDLARDGDDYTLRQDAGAVQEAITRPAVVLATGAALLMLFVFQGLTTFFTTYLVEVKGLTQGAAGGLFALMFVCGAGFQSIAGPAADRYGHGRLLVAIALVSVPPLAALPFADGFAALVVVTALLGIRPAVAPISNAYIVGVLPEQVQGATWGLLRTGFFTVSSFASVLVGVLADRDRFAEAFVLLAVLTGVAAVLYYFLPRREDATRPPMVD